MNGHRRHFGLPALLMGIAASACDVGHRGDTPPSDLRMPDAVDASSGEVVGAAHDVIDAGLDAAIDDRQPEPDGAEDAGDGVLSDPDGAEDASDTLLPTDIADDRTEVADVDRSDGDEVPGPDPACSECDDDSECIDGVCLVRVGTPCVAEESCGVGRVCGIGGLCAASNAPGDVGMYYVGSPYVSWPAMWLFDSAVRDPITFGLSTAFAEAEEGTLEVVVAATSDGINNLCRFRVEGHAWSRDESICSGEFPDLNTAAFVPPHSDNPGRWVLGGNERVVVADRNLVPQSELYRPDVAAGDQPCAAFAIYAIDLDLDGLLDVLVNCHGPTAAEGTVRQTLLFRASADGGFERMRGLDASAFEREAVLLALPGFDVNDDGLLDFAFVTDTFSSPARRNTTNVPTVVVLRCAPTQGCKWQDVPIDPGIDAWGSHMGAGIVRVDTIGSLLALSDLGPRDLRDFRSLPFVDAAARAGFDGGWDEEMGEYLFSWSMAVADLDRNGLNDVFVTQAMPEIHRYGPHEVPAHADLLLLQRGGGTFETRSESEWLVHLDGTPIAPELTQYNRGAIVQDFDLDGRLDVYINQHGRAPVLYEERGGEHPPRCVLRFVPGVVPTAGPGIQTGRTALGPWDAAVLQGEMRLQAPLRAVVDDRTGFVRFPSGAVVPYDCGDTVGPHDVVEPDWLRFEHGDAAIRILLDRSAWPEPIESVEVAWVDADRRLLATGTPDDDVVPVPDVAGVDAFMLRINGRWVGRFFGLVAPE